MTFSPTASKEQTALDLHRSPQHSARTARARGGAQRAAPSGAQHAAPSSAASVPVRMALVVLSDDELSSIFSRLCNPLRPCDAVDFGSANHGLWVLTQVLRQQLREWHEAAAALGCKVRLQTLLHGGEAAVRMRKCRALRETTCACWVDVGLSATDLTTLATLSSMLPALGELRLIENLPTGKSGPDGVQRLAAGLRAGALPALTLLQLDNMYVGNAGASALGAALSLGALPRLEKLLLDTNGIGDAGLIALAPALRRLPALQQLLLVHNPLGDEGLAALVAPPPPPPPPTGVLLPPTEVLTKLKELTLSYSQISDAGCAALAAAFDRGALPECNMLNMRGNSAGSAAQANVVRALRSSVELRAQPTALNAWGYCAADLSTT